MLVVVLRNIWTGVLFAGSCRALAPGRSSLTMATIILSVRLDIMRFVFIAPDPTFIMYHRYTSELGSESLLLFILPD